MSGTGGVYFRFEIKIVSKYNNNVGGGVAAFLYLYFVVGLRLILGYWFNLLGVY